MALDLGARVRSINRRATALAVLNILVWATVIAVLAWAQR